MDLHTALAIALPILLFLNLALLAYNSLRGNPVGWNLFGAHAAAWGLFNLHRGPWAGLGYLTGVALGYVIIYFVRSYYANRG